VNDPRVEALVDWWLKTDGLPGSWTDALARIDVADPLLPKVAYLIDQIEHALVVLMRPEAWDEVLNLRVSLSDAVRALTLNDMARVRQAAPADSAPPRPV
jgi:hypothetical protein